MTDWMDGPYYVKDRVGRVTAGIKAGEILVRCNDDGKPNGIIALRCPACMSVQFRHAFVDGPDNKPTLDRVLTCGCKSMCGAQFRIITGEAKKVEPDEIEKPSIPQHLLDRGVKYPPQNNC